MTREADIERIADALIDVHSGPAPWPGPMTSTQFAARLYEAGLGVRPSVEPLTRCPDGMIDCNGHGYNTVSGSRMACLEAHTSVEPGGLATRLAECERRLGVRLARERRARDRYRERHPEVHRKSARESMARCRANRALLPTQASDSPDSRNAADEDDIVDPPDSSLWEGLPATSWASDSPEKTT